MGIYIKGMEMPTEGGTIVVYKISGKFFAARAGKDELCPLVPVPPHGRLIDADDAIGHLFNGEQCLYSWDEIEEAIDATETVIPAEEGE